MYLSSHGYIFIGCWATVNTLNFNYGLDHFAVSVENVLSCLFFPAFPVARTHLLLMLILVSL